MFQDDFNYEKNQNFGVENCTNSSNNLGTIEKRCVILTIKRFNLFIDQKRGA